MQIKYQKYYNNTLVVAGLALFMAGCEIDSTDLPEPAEEIVNSAPTITSSAVLTAQANTAYSYTLTASDVDSGDILTLSASQVPSWLTFETTTGELAGTPSTGDIGEHPVSLLVSDGTDEISEDFVVVVSAITVTGEWTLLWSDEFNDNGLNSDNWNIETGDGSQYGIPGWGNNELEWYSADNIAVEQGNLVITAMQQESNGYAYTSGRLRTDNKLDIKYGRIEARIQVPPGQGLWSAFWMLPTDSRYGGWASGGEIDILEAVNQSTGSLDQIHSTLHYGMAWPLNVNSTQSFDIAAAEDFHTYAIEWEQDDIRWYIDDLHFATVTSSHWWSYYYDDLDPGYVSAPNAPFNQDFHLLLNLAVGGNLPGAPDGSTVFPAQMLVDYVRVYQCDAELESGAGCGANINPEVSIPSADQVFTASYLLYQDAVAEISWQVGEQTVNRALTAAVAWDNNGAISLTEQEIDGEHGMVLDIETSDMGNIAIYAADGDTFDLYGMGDSAEPWKLHAAELKFDLFIDGAATPDDSSILIKMDSGWPALGSKQLEVADLAKDSWISVSVLLNDLVANPGDQPLDTSAVLNLFVIEFTASAHVQLDNIRLICGHMSDGGCGIKAPTVELNDEVLEVFTETVNTDVWTSGIGAWDSIANSDYFSGDSNNHVTWQLIDSGDSEHGTVIEVNFSQNGADGLIYIKSAQALNLDSFSDGELIFDIKVTDYADTTGGISYKIDCVFPCTSGDQLLGVIADGEWQTISLSVANLISQGLDITSVDTGLVLFPTWGDQQGVSLQLDNIRWQNGEDTPPPPAGAAVVIYADQIDSNWTLWDCCGGATLTEVTDNAEQGNVVEVTFNGNSTVSGVEASTPYDASNLSNGTLEFDLKMVSAPSDASAEWLLKLESVGAATAVEVTLSSSNEGLDPSLDTWQHFTFDLETLNAQGLDLTQLKLIMIFPSWGKSASAVYRLDNLVINGE